MLFQGLGVSQGTARGPVRHVTGIEDADRFQSGDILVTRITDPTMVSMMAKAGAIVCEVGGLTSHPSIVSREMGTPCVVRVGNGLSALKEGVIVEVDGSAGTVRLVDDDASPNDTDVDGFLVAAVSGNGEMDYETFSDVVSWDRYDPLIAEPWTRRIMGMIKDWDKSGFSPKQFGDASPSVSELRANMFFNLAMAKHSSISAEERLAMFTFYSDALKALVPDDPYGHSSNRRHTKMEQQEFVAETVEGSPEDARALGRLVNACYHFAHALYSDMHPCVVYDNYGPYDVSDSGKNNSIVVKRFRNLAQREVWPEASPFSFDDIQVVAVYEGVRMTVDTCSHVQYIGDPVQGLRRYALLVDGNPVSIEEVDGLSEQIESVAMNVFQKYKLMDLEEKKRLYCFQKSYSYRDVYAALGQDWQPSQEILDAMKDKPLYDYQWPADKKAADDLLRRILDPRVDL